MSVIASFHKIALIVARLGSGPRLMGRIGPGVRVSDSFHILRLSILLIYAFVHCRLDYCNSALAGVAKVYLQKLQSVQNVAARMVSGV